MQRKEKKKGESHKLLKARGSLIPPNRPHKSKKAYDRRKAKQMVKAFCR
jgi:hypothetical protein